MTDAEHTDQGAAASALERAAQAVAGAIEATSLEPAANDWSELAFDAHAIALFRAQYAQVPAYRAWCEYELGERDTRVEQVRRWFDVPALPISAFKRLDVRCEGLTLHPHDDAEWWSSGTTGSERSRHVLPDTGLYTASLDYGVEQSLLAGAPGDSLLAVQLAPAAADAPHSSLSFMLDRIRVHWCADGGAWVDAAWRLNAHAAWSRLCDAARDNEPVLILATSFALVQLLEATADRAALTMATGSRVMDTGGYKGRSRQLDRRQLLEFVEQRLGIPSGMCENEYGMSELSSQAWLGTIAATTGRPLPGTLADGARWQPPWMRTRVVDPATLQPVADGEEGLLVHHDLANAWSCSAIRTEDVGVRRGRSYELVGRAAGASLRGCSLQLEDLV